MADISRNVLIDFIEEASGEPATDIDDETLLFTTGLLDSFSLIDLVQILESETGTRIGEQKVVHSGDMVRIDEDGDMWFVGRADGMIKCSGFRLSPTEVEEIAQQSSLITEAVAFGVDDDALGQVVHVAVGRGGAGDVDVDSLRTHCNANMPSYMVPTNFHCWTTPMPRTPSGKIDRRSVVADCRSRLDA